MKILKICIISKYTCQPFLKKKMLAKKLGCKKQKNISENHQFEGGKMKILANLLSLSILVKKLFSKNNFIISNK